MKLWQSALTQRVKLQGSLSILPMLLCCCALSQALLPPACHPSPSHPLCLPLRLLQVWAMSNSSLWPSLGGKRSCEVPIIPEDPGGLSNKARRFGMWSQEILVTSSCIPFTAKVASKKSSHAEPLKNCGKIHNV